MPSVRAMPSNKWTDEVANLASESVRACIIANQVFVVVTESMFQEDPAADDDDVSMFQELQVCLPPLENFSP